VSNPPKGARHKYELQKRDAEKNRNIKFFMAFEEWWSVWDKSGHWHERGPSPDQYCMARYRDRGPYAVGNVRIITCRENRAEHTYRTSEATRAKLSAALSGNQNTLGHQQSDEHRAKISAAMVGNQCARGNRFKKSPEAIARSRAAHLGCKRSEQAKQNIRRAAQLRAARRREQRSAST
jgi:hypothetical protein